MATSSQWESLTWWSLTNGGRAQSAGTNQVEIRIFAQSLQCSVYWVPDRTGQAMSGKVEMDKRGTEVVVDIQSNDTNHHRIIRSKTQIINRTEHYKHTINNWQLTAKVFKPYNVFCRLIWKDHVVEVWRYFHTTRESLNEDFLKKKFNCFIQFYRVDTYITVKNSLILNTTIKNECFK